MKMPKKIAIVTGGANGIGRATSVLLAKSDYSVVVADVEDVQGAETERELNSLGSDGFYRHTDVTNPNEVQAIVGKTIEKFGRVDALVNAVGGWGLYGIQTKPLWELTDNDWQRTLDINLKSAFLCNRATIPHMIRQKSGRIVNFSSIAVPANSSLQIVYTIAKAGIVAMTKALAHDLLPQGILVNAIGPGTTDTRVWHGSRSDALKFEEMVKQTPFQRAMKPEEIAEAVLFVAKSDSITGQIIYVGSEA